MKRAFFVIPFLSLGLISATAVAAGFSSGDIIEAKRTFTIEAGTVETAVFLATPGNPYSCYLKHDPASNTRFIKKGSRFQVVDDRFSIERLSNRELVELIARAGGTVSKDI